MSAELTKRFKRAVDYIQKLPSDAPYQSSNQEKLEFYGLFKQSTDGENKTKSPSRLNVVAKMKWYVENISSISEFKC